MPTLGRAYLSSVLMAAEGPCVSIYLPTGKPYPENRQDAIRFKNLVRAAEEALAKRHPGPVARDVVAKLHTLPDNADFWSTPGSGAAILASPKRLDAFKLPHAVPEWVEVGETFHVKPLIRHVQSADRFHVLGLARERVALFEGDRYELHSLAVPGLPLTLTDALGTETEPTTWRYHTAGPGSAVRGARGTHGVAISSGQGGWKDEIEIDTHRFFLVIDRAVIDLVSNPSGLPLIPMGLEENLAEFRAITSNRFVTADGVTGDWTNWSLHEIREKAWKVFEKHYRQRLASICEDFGTAAARKRATPDPVDAAAAVVAGRVGTLLIDADKTLPGSIEMTTGTVRPAGPADAQPGDILDDLAELGLRHGSMVTVVPSDQMPSTSGLAAIYRF